MKLTLAETVNAAVVAQAKGNSHTTAPVAAVLWTDKEGQWQSVIPFLKNLMPGLCVLGPLDSEQRSGPAIWLKCAIAGVMPEIKLDGAPVVYLPGVSRADLRAIESCPKDLQPLAELQYRGAFWSQANGKDWTVNAFLTSKSGGLGLDVAQDKDTQEALAQVLDTGVLLEKTVSELRDRQINAEWLNSLLVPNPTRDLLAWLNDPNNTQSQWEGARWNVFHKRCKSDYGFDPLSDGTLVAAEKLAQTKGAWAAVWELYRDSYTSFPHVKELLARVQPPQLGLFDDLSQLEGYPKANDAAETTLRSKLLACESMAPDQARATILELDKEHGLRRKWLWAMMGTAPLACSLEHLCKLATLSSLIPLGTNLEQLAQNYVSTGWQVDHAALKALGSVQSKSDSEAVAQAARAIYLPWLQELAERFQQVVKDNGGLEPKPDMASTQSQPDGVCTVFVDGLRYDVAVQLQDLLLKTGKVELGHCWTSVPSVTASGKAWSSPVAHMISGDKIDQNFEPRVAADGKPLSGYNFKRLLAEQGIQTLDKHDAGDPSGRAWVECGDLDHYGHEHGTRLARDMETQLNQVAERIAELKDAGWTRFRIVTDHGWLLMPGGLPKAELAKHQAETRWGRCAVLKEMAHGTPLTFGWSWCGDVQIAFAPGVSNFYAGVEYAHGGLSLQECLVPVLSLQTVDASKSPIAVSIKNVTWRGLRCLVEVEPEYPGLKADIRTKPAQPSSSLAASVKMLEGGKANLAVVDDEHLGSAAVVVILDSNSNMVQKVGTTVGG